MKYLSLLVVFFLFSCDARAQENTRPSLQNPVYQDLSVEDFSTALDLEGILLLDVRTPEEFEALHIPGALLIPVQELENRIGEIEEFKEAQVYVYCRSGNRSRTASQILLNQGFNTVYNLDLGINQWAALGYPVE